MTKDIYTPQQDGIAGFEEFGDIEHGTNYEREHAVSVDGKTVVGPCTHRAAVAEFLRVNDINPALRCNVAFDDTAPNNRRREFYYGLPDKFCGPVRIAEGALRFGPGWDASKQARVKPEQLASDGTHTTGYAGRVVTPGFREDLESGNFAR